MALLDYFSNNGKADGDSFGSLFTRLKDAAGNALTRIQRALLVASAEAMLIAGRNDSNAVMIRVDRKGNILIGNYNAELQEPFEGATVNVQKWTPTSTTFVGAQTTLGGYSFNSTALTTTGAVAILQSQRLIYKLPRVPVEIKTRLRHSMVANSVSDLGFGFPSGTSVIVPNGTVFRITASGVIQGVITYNGSEIAIANIVSTVATNGNTIGGNLNMSSSYYTNGYFVYSIICDDDNVVFTIQDTSTGELVGTLTLPVPNTFQKMWGATALPFFIRCFNSSTPASAPVLIATELQVLCLDMSIQNDANQVAGNLGLTIGRHPYTGVPLTNHTNNAAPTSATLSNTLAGYSAPDGKFQFAAVAGAETDYALFAFQIPASSKFLCEGVRIEAFNLGAIVATTPTLLEWALGFNSSAVSLATANIVRKQVGVQSFPVGAAIGAKVDALEMRLETPELVEGNRFVHVILRMPVGTATASQVIRGTVTLKGRYI
jgi:hypothetical protein